MILDAKGNPVRTPLPDMEMEDVPLIDVRTAINQKLQQLSYQNAMLHRLASILVERLELQTWKRKYANLSKHQRECKRNLAAHHRQKSTQNIIIYCETIIRTNAVIAHRMMEERKTLHNPRNLLQITYATLDHTKPPKREMRIALDEQRHVCTLQTLPL